MEKWHDILYKIARKYNIPILNLNKTFDVSNRSHYGTIDIHPSNISNKCIAKCITYIPSHYDGYHIYYATNCDSSKIKIE